MTTAHEPAYPEDGMPKARYCAYHTEKAANTGAKVEVMTPDWIIVSDIMGILIKLFLVLWPACIWAQECDDGLACEIEVIATRGIHQFDIGSEVPLLTGFELEFLGEDRHVRRIGVGVLPDEPSTFTLLLQDNDGVESIRAWARYYRYAGPLTGLRAHYRETTDSPVLNLRSVSLTACRSECRVNIPGFDKLRYRIFLAGFRFIFNNEDRHLRRIRVWPVGDVAGPTGVSVALKDNSDDQPFDVVLSYVLMPLDHVVGGVLYGGTVTETDDEGVVRFFDRNLSGRALSGFGADYADDDEHLRKIGIKVDRQGGMVTLRDNDTREDITPWIASWRLPVE